MDGSNYFFIVVVLIGILVILFVVANSYNNKLGEYHNELNGLKNKEKEILQEREKLQSDLGFYESILKELDESHQKARVGIAKYIAIKESVPDLEAIQFMRVKPHPAIKRSEEMERLKEEKIQLKTENTVLLSQLNTYKEYFDFARYFNMEEEEEDDSEVEADEGQDPVSHYLTAEEYDNLSLEEKNQLALDRYLNQMGKQQIGKFYETYIGWLLENQGFRVKYEGIEKGLEDRGRDLIAWLPNSPSHKKIIQAKCWSLKKTIHEKHIYQLFASTYELKLKYPKQKFSPEFVTTTELSPYAKFVAEKLGIAIRYLPLKKDWPMIKCNINPKKERIYHLPFDQKYDATKINKKKGEAWASSVKEAMALGFRRAYRWKGTNKNF